MCTLTFIPHPNSVIITSNRDEHISRGMTDFPITKVVNQQKVYFPQDPKAGGTWIASSDQGRINVLLNGALVKHKHRPPYRKSRGIILLETYEYESLREFNATIDLDQIEPFTLIQFNIEQKTIEELRWDGAQKHFKTLAFDSPHIWSSTTLYDEETRKRRRTWFADWLQQPNLTPKQMLAFHQFKNPDDTSNSITMNRGMGLQTVSITQIAASGNQISFSHNNLLNNQNNTIQLPE